MTETISVKAEYREKFKVKHLAMVPSLQGKAVSFHLDDHSIKIELPTFSPEAKLSPGMEAEADTWDSTNGNVLSVYIYVVRVIIEDLTFTIPATAAQHEFVNTPLFSSAEREALDQKSDELYLLARQALDLFIRTARWKTGMALLDVDNRPDSPSLNGGRLINLAHGGSFYVPRISRIAVVPPRINLTSQIWQSIADALTNGEAPPVWSEFAASAARRIEVADLQAGVIDLAIGAEAAIRQFPRVSMTKRKNKLSTILDNWDQFGFPPAGQWFSDLRTLIDVRNQIMHSGADKRLNLSFCKKSLSAVKSLTGLLT
jgi:hypothetical protein